MEGRPLKKRSIRSTIAAMVTVVTFAATVSASLPFANGGFENGTYGITGGFKTLGCRGRTARVSSSMAWSEP